MINSRTKGKTGELEAAKLWQRLTGSPTRRGQQYSGGAESPDIVSEDHPILNLEVKRCEQVDLEGWFEKAKETSPELVPVILHRKNGEDWKVTVKAEDIVRVAMIMAAVYIERRKNGNNNEK